VLGLDGDILGIQLAIGNQLGQMLDDVGLGRDGVSGDDIYIGKLYRFPQSD
jgi:hypothetical protein